MKKRKYSVKKITDLPKAESGAPVVLAEENQKLKQFDLSELQAEIHPNNIEHHTYDNSGVITPAIDNFKNGIHILTHDPGGEILPNIGISFDVSIDINTKKIHIFRTEYSYLSITLIHSVGGFVIKSCGTFRCSPDYDLFIEAKNIDGVIYVEGKVYY